MERACRGIAGVYYTDDTLVDQQAHCRGVLMFANSLLHILALATIPGTTADRAPAVDQTRAPAPATRFVRDFFAALDRRDVRGVRESFVPTATIVHDDGVEQNVSQFLASVSSADHWYPRTRAIDCQVEERGEIVVAGCLNRVTFHHPDGRQVPVAYNETWILRRTAAGLKAVRTHYSRIRRSSHSE
jgi:ketosteroid isomerase-like protein